jgi:hypothetical protein
VWTSHERSSAQARTLEQKGPYLLPVRLDDTEVPGLRPSTSYLDGSVRSPQEIASIFLQKINADGGVRSADSAASEELLGVPLTEAERERIASLRPPCWEYLLMAGGIWQGVRAPERKNLDHDLRYAAQSARYLEDDEILAFLTEANRRIGSILYRMESVISPENQERALGAPGEPGDAVLIDHMCRRFGNSYEELLDWASSLRGVSCADRYRDLLELLARYSEPAVSQIRRFADDLVTQVSRIPAHLAEENPEKLEIIMELTLTLDDEVSELFLREAERALGARP